MRGLIAGLVMAAWSGVQTYAQDNGWGDLDALLLSTLSPAGQLEAAFWMPDSADPIAARVALAVAYVSPEGVNAAGSVNIHAGVYEKRSQGWVQTHPVRGLFGTSPRDVLYLGDRIEVTMTVPGPNDPRCCPTDSARFSILRSTGDALRTR